LLFQIWGRVNWSLLNSTHREFRVQMGSCRRRPPQVPPLPAVFARPLLAQPLQASPLSGIQPLARPLMILPPLVRLLSFPLFPAARWRSTRYGKPGNRFHSATIGATPCRAPGCTNMIHHLCGLGFAPHGADKPTVCCSYSASCALPP
jgi:hypothetical protein